MCARAHERDREREPLIVEIKKKNAMKILNDCSTWIFTYVQRKQSIKHKALKQIKEHDYRKIVMRDRESTFDSGDQKQKCNEKKKLSIINPKLVI